MSTPGCLTASPSARDGHDPAALRRDMVFTVGSKLLYLLTRLAIPPLVLSHVDLHTYWLWSTCFILVSYIGMSASGFSAVYVRYVAHYHARNDTNAIARLLSTGILTMGGLALLMLCGLWLVTPTLLDWFHVEAGDRTTATALWMGACAIFLLDTSVGAFAYVLHGLQLIRREQQIWMAAYVLEMLCIMLFLHLGMGIYGLLAAFGTRYVFSITTSAWVVARRLPQLQLRPALFDRSCLKIFFGFGSLVQIGGLISTVLHSADRLLASLFMGPAASALLELAGKLPSTGASLASSVSMVSLPAAARHNALGAQQALLQTYHQAVRATGLLAALILPPLACFAPVVITLWLGPRDDHASLSHIMTWVALGIHLHILTGPASSTLRGQGRIANEYVYHGLRILGYASGLSVLYTAHQITPTTLATALAVGGLLASTLYLALSHRQITGQWQGGLRCYALPFGLPYLLAVGSWLLAQQISPGVAAERGQALPQLATAALLYALLTAWLVWRWYLSPEQRQSIRQRLSLAPAHGRATSTISGESL